MDKKIYFENDHELLYLIRNHNEEALEIMFKKYEGLIYSKILKYRFPLNAIEDYLQEGRMALLKAIETYQESYEKTFTRYFELVLQNRFNTLYKEAKKYHNSIVLVENEEIDNNKENQTNDKMEAYFDTGALSEVEKTIFNLYYTNNCSIEDIAKTLEMTPKQVYNTIYRIKTKLQKRVVKNNK